jgi:branched-chain amino acid transport system permease protein
MKAILGTALIALVLLAVPFVVAEVHLRISTEIVLLSLLAIAFNLQFGYAGMLNFGINSAFGIGAYAAALSAIGMTSLGALVAIVLGMMAALAFGLLTGPLAVRLRGGYFALLTLGLSQFLFTLAMRWRDVTHGDDGLFLRDDLTLLPGGIGLSTGSATTCFVLASIVGLTLGGGLWFLLRTPFGVTIILLRENEERAEALGINTFAARLAVYTLSSAIAGAAGAVYAIFQKVVTPNLFGIQFGGDITIMTLIGGTGAFLGPVLGVGLYEVLQDWLGQITTRWQFFMGLLLVLVVLFMPGGMAGLFRLARERVVTLGASRSSKVQLAEQARRAS